MDTLLILMKLVGVACVGAGGALLAARVLRADRWYAWLSRREYATGRMVLAGVSVAALLASVAIMVGVARVDFTRLSVGVGLWVMIAGPMLAWPVLMSGRERTADAQGDATLIPESQPTSKRRAA